jgi:hypothetical protein
VPALLGETFALSLTLVFAAAAVSKFQAFGAWTGVVQNFRVLPRALVVPVAWVLPPLEALLAAALLVTALRPLAAACAALLLVVFSAAIAANLRRGRTEIDCGCFRSDLRQSLSAALLVRNALLFFMALALLPAGGDTVRTILEHAIAACAALCLFLCYLSVGLLFRPVSRVLPA